MTQIQLRDGRALDLLDNHVESDIVVLFHHGTPGKSTSWCLSLTRIGSLALAHSHWLASKIPHTQPTFIPENGHIFLIVKHRDKIVTQLQQLLAQN